MSINKNKVIPIIVIVVALSLLAVWEMYGKEKVIYAEMLVASRTIEKHETITAEMLETRLYPRDAIAESALKPSDETAIVGKAARCVIPQNTQISLLYVYSSDFYLKDGEAIYKIEAGWINGISSSVRRGDTVGIYAKGGNYLIGKYKVAFVKDQTQREITDSEGKNKADALSRTNATSAINHIEVIATMSGYKKIYDAAQLGETFLIVQEETDE